MQQLKQLAGLVAYDPFTGLFFDGTRELGTRHSKGYVNIKLAGCSVLAHRLAWFIAYGNAPRQLDHINRDKTDNRLANLREATPSQNQCNRGLQSNNASGCSGVARNRQDTAWQAYIKVGGKRHHLGTFKDLAAAIDVRKANEVKYFGEFRPQ